MTWALIALAAWRLAVLLVVDDGPAGIFRRLREATWREGRPVPLLGEALTCVGCVSLWTALAAAAAWWAGAEPAVGVLAAWGAATYLHRLTR